MRRFRLDTVASIAMTWALAWLPDGRLLVTERPGRVRIIENGKLRPEPVFTVPDVEPSSESGLMDITLHPAFASNNFIYLAYAYNQDGKRVKVVRYKFAGDKFTEPKIILEGVPGAPNHAGMRCDFEPDGKLYISAGDLRLGTTKSRIRCRKILLVQTRTTARHPFVSEKRAPRILATVRNPRDGVAPTSSCFRDEPARAFLTDPLRHEVILRKARLRLPLIHHRDTKEGMYLAARIYPSVARDRAVLQGTVFPVLRHFFSEPPRLDDHPGYMERSTVVAQEAIEESSTHREVAEGLTGDLVPTSIARSRRGADPRPCDLIVSRG